MFDLWLPPACTAACSLSSGPGAREPESQGDREPGSQEAGSQGAKETGSQGVREPAASQGADMRGSCGGVRLGGARLV